MSVGSIGVNPGATSASALSLRAASAQAAASNAKSAEEAQESATERQQEVAGGEESGSAPQKSVGGNVNLLA